MQAIRIDKTIVKTGKTHVDIFMDWLKSENMSEDDGDTAIEEGRIEFGSCWLNTKTNLLEFSTDETRTSVYKDIHTLYQCKRFW